MTGSIRVTLLICLFFLVPRLPAAEQQDEGESIGFHDKDNDGINDRFRDGDGDGVNDVTGKKYTHKFEFSDENKDGINDLWVDKDGDGVNDYLHKLSEADRKRPEKCVVDSDGDGNNDITGVRYSGGDFSGQKCGFMDEQSGKILGKFLDTDGNGIDDRLENRDGHYGRKGRDMFIDTDGDGICDGRGDTLRRQERHRNKQKSQHN